MDSVTEMFFRKYLTEIALVMEKRMGFPKIGRFSTAEKGLQPIPEI